MKKLFIFFILFAFATFLPSAFAYQIKADATTKRLPMGTKINLVMAESLTTAEVEEGDMFQALTTSDIKLDGKTILPKGTLVRGMVKGFDKTKLLSRSANLYLTFDHIVTPQGRQLPINAGISSGFNMKIDGGISGGGGYGCELKRNVQKTGDIIVGATNWGIEAGDEMFTGAKFVLAPISAVAGTFGGAVYLVGDSIIDLFRYGSEVIINQGQVFDVILFEALDVPVS